MIAKQRYMVIFDTDASASQPRLHLVDLQTGKVKSTEAATGTGSGFQDNTDYHEGDPDNPRAKINSTPLGFFSTGPVTHAFPERPTAVTLYGLEPTTPGGFNGNSDISSASGGLLIHPADYVKPGHAGQSHGCPALNPSVFKDWLPELQDGALFYFYSKKLDAMKRSDTVAGLASGQNGVEAAPRVGQTAVIADTDPRVVAAQMLKNSREPSSLSSAAGACPAGAPVGAVCEATTQGAY